MQGSGVATLGGEQNARAGRIEPWLAATFLVLAAVILYSISWTLPAWSEGGSFQLKAILGYFALPELDAITHPVPVTPIAEAVVDDPAALDAVWQALTPREPALFLKWSAQQELQKAGE